MAKTKKEPEPGLPVVYECEEPGCEYVLYDAGDDDRAGELEENHRRQHEDPEGWREEN